MCKRIGANERYIGTNEKHLKDLNCLSFDITAYKYALVPAFPIYVCASRQAKNFSCWNVSMSESIVDNEEIKLPSLLS